MIRLDTTPLRRWLVLAALLAAPCAEAHKLHPRDEPTTVAESSLTVIPGRDWNQLGPRLGKNTETWTLDGEQLNDVTFFGGIAPGNPLVKERNKKREPLPQFMTSTLLAEVPELLERTWRSTRTLGTFAMTAEAPTTFLGTDGIAFRYEFTDEDQLTRKGEAKAAIIHGHLYMITFEAPRLNYFDKALGDFHALLASARLR